MDVVISVILLALLGLVLYALLRGASEADNHAQMLEDDDK